MSIEILCAFINHEFNALPFIDYFSIPVLCVDLVFSPLCLPGVFGRLEEVIGPRAEEGER